MKRQLRWIWVLTAGFLAASGAAAQSSDSMIAVSADIVEISGSVTKNEGFLWGGLSGSNFLQNTLSWTESSIPGIIKVGDFARKTALQTQLTMLETEGKAQTLTNPKVIVQDGQTASFTVGAKIPYPTVNVQGVGTNLEQVANVLNVGPQVVDAAKGTIRAEVQIELSAPDYSHSLTTAGGGTVPTITLRQVQTWVEMKSGETLVIGGFKQSNKNITVTKLPLLGDIPLLGAFFRTTSIVNDDSTLYMFITLEVIK